VAVCARTVGPAAVPATSSTPRPSGAVWKAGRRWVRLSWKRPLADSARLLSEIGNLSELIDCRL